MYLDTETERVNVGGAGAALYYGKATDPVENKETLYWHLPINSLEDQKDNPKIDDIILNKDGAFYRILAINSTDFICSRLAVSGNGSSTGPNISSEIRPEINVVNNLNTTSLINGQDFSVFVTVSSYLTASGIPYDNLFTVQWTLTDVATETVYKKGNFDAQHNVEIELPLGDYLRDNTTTKITVWATGGNHDKESR